MRRYNSAIRLAWRWPWLLLALSACSGQPETGPIEVKWDRQTCVRCSMVLSDRFHSAQVRVKEQGKRSKVHLFDDIGCAVIWLEDKPWRDDADTEIWVTDHRNGNWIDARRAYYLPDQVTPMEYGLGAQADAAEGAFSFDQARSRIFELEARFNSHGVHLQQSSRERQQNEPATERRSE